MKHRSKQLFTALISVAALGCGACSTTTQNVWPSQAALGRHNIDVGDTVLVRYLNDPYSGVRASSRSEQVRITGIRPIEFDHPATKIPERIMQGTLKVAYIAVCVTGGC